MSRITTEELYGLDPKSFIGQDYDLVIKQKLDASWVKIIDLSENMRKSNISYEEVSAYSHEYKYYSGAISDLMQEYEEMGLKYIRDSKR